MVKYTKLEVYGDLVNLSEKSILNKPAKRADDKPHHPLPAPQWLALLLACASLLSLASMVCGQEIESPGTAPEHAPYKSIIAIRTNPIKDRAALLEGQVVSLIRTLSGTESYYYLQDDSGRKIKISTAGKLPRAKRFLIVEGTVDFIHNPERELIVREKRRSDKPPEKPAPAERPQYRRVDSSQPAMPKTAESGNSIEMLIIFAVVILVLLGAAAAVFLVFKSRKPPAEPEPAKAKAAAVAKVEKVTEEEPPAAEAEELPPGEAESEDAAEETEEPLEGKETEESLEGEEIEESLEGEEIEESLEGEEIEEENIVPRDREEILGEMVRTYYPLSGEELSLPGRLEIVGGENELRELYFRLSKNETHKVFTFGNRESIDFGHFEIKHDSVSKNQARIDFSGGQFELVNYGLENATRVNSIELEDGGRIVLDPGDSIEMGVLEMVFHTASEEEDLPGMTTAEAEEEQPETDDTDEDEQEH